MRLAFLPALAGVLVFAPALLAGFVADDFTVLDTVAAVDGPLWAFERSDLGELGGSGRYRPLWVLFNAAAVELFGESAPALHALNLVLFAIVAVEVLLLVRFAAGRAALLAALAFALYPRHAESVAWITGNTELLATATGLGALLCAIAPWPNRRRMACAAALVAAAALMKETAFALPLLAALLLALSPPDSSRPEREGRIAIPLAMGLALVPVLVARTIVLDGGTGAFSLDPITPVGLLTAAASFAVAAAAPHQLEVLSQPLLALVPLALVAIAAIAVWRLRKRGDRERLRVVALGLAWFAVALAPALGQPVDLNNATGERLLFLPSVGLAIALAALLPDRLTRRARAVTAGAAAAGALLCVLSAYSWVTAGEIAEDTVSSAVRLAPPEGGELVLLSIPESYRNAHVFTNSFDRAVARAGRPDLRVSWCAPVHIRTRERGRIAFAPDEPGTFLGTAAREAPFDFPLRGEPGRLSAGCGYERAPGGALWPGLRLHALARPAAANPPRALLVFDGAVLERLPASEGERR